jgi:toxin ParE1/3/4
MRTDFAEFQHEAATEYDAAFEWYLERSPEAALKFDSEVERALAQIVQAPKRWALGSHSTRRFLLRHFPFVLIYRERPSAGVQIVALAHTSRKPGYWTARL